MIKHILFGAFSAAVALGAGSAMADDPRTEQLHAQTDFRAHQSADDARGAGHNGAQAVRHTGRMIGHGAQTAWDATHAAEYNARHPNTVRGDELNDQRDFRAHQTTHQARMMGHATARSTRDTGAMMEHGAETSGDAMHQTAHAVRPGDQH